MLRNEKLAKFIDNTALYALCLLVAALPLYFTPIAKTASGFIVGLAIDKGVFFNIFVIILALLSVAKIVVEGRIVVYSASRRWLVLLPLLSALLVSTFLSLDQHSSFYGFYWRQQGLVAWLYMALFVLTLLPNLSSREKAEKIINSILLGSLAVSLIGLMQWLKFDFLNLQSFGESRPGSTLGQPVFLGNFLVLTILLAVYKMVAVPRFWPRFGYALIFSVQALCLVATYTRGAWIGFVVGGILLAVYLSVSCSAMFTRKKTAYLALLVFLLLTSILVRFSVSATGDGSGAGIVARVKSSFNPSSGSAYLRMQYWEGAIKMIADRPVFGYGLEGQRLLFLDYYAPSWGAHEKVSSLSDRAHNEFLDLGVTTGLFGLLSYLMICGLVGLIYWRNLRDPNRSRENLFLAVIASSLAGYWASIFFSFSITETNMLFWLYFALLLIAAGHFEKKEVPLEFVKKNKHLTYYVFVTIVVIASIQVVENVYKIEADYYAVKAKFASSRGDQVLALNSYIKATSLNPNEELYRDSYIAELTNFKPSMINLDNEEPQSNGEFVKSVLEQDADLQPNYFRSLRKGMVFSYLARQGDHESFKQAESVYSGLVDRYPNLPDPAYQLGVLYYNDKRFASSTHYIERVFRLLPDPVLTPMNDDHRQALGSYLSDKYFMLGMAYYQLGDFQKSNDAMFRVIDASPYNVYVYQYIAWNYYRLKELDQSIRYYKRALDFDHVHFQLPLQLAKIYIERKDYGAARQYLQRAQRLNPEDATIKDLLAAKYE